ncbi:helix-turn-helix domain-containing protein [Paraclostridium bifermentans]|uniref:helix-turn-helix domain-containing protein n=1 Tax=Paraclostridium bifermentans TaxID=1490 RepID=UPI0024325B55|nr:helix-turn-helix transcriptional regulator [Paraclostridium bifermentans]MDU3801825.1 helix-turn-helix transcriptional regulator [Paraclostridium bifermentans]
MAFIEEKLIFANRLREERERLGLMQKEMAQKLEVPPNTYNGYETGKRSPSLEVARHIADTLEISVDYLLGRTDRRNITKEKSKLDPSIKTIAAHRLSDIEDLDDDAIDKINEYIEFIRMQHNKK